MIPGLDARSEALVVAVLQRHPEIREARLFGSRAMGRHRDQSDIDLALIGPVDQRLLGCVLTELDELPLPWQFDVKAYDDLRDAALRNHIDRRGVVVYQANV
jgi:predicted nucleotidyltransferase